MDALVVTEWSHYLISGPGDFFKWWYTHMPFVGMMLETISLVTIVCIASLWVTRKVLCRKEETLYSERVVQTETHWNHKRSRYYYGHDSVLVVNTGTYQDLRRANLVQGPVLILGSQNVVLNVEKKPSQHVLDALDLGEQCVLNNPEQGLTGIGQRVAPTAPTSGETLSDEQEAAENVAMVNAMLGQDASSGGSSSSSSGDRNGHMCGGNHGRCTNWVVTGTLCDECLRAERSDGRAAASGSTDSRAAASGSTPDMERFFRPAGTGSEESGTGESDRNRAAVDKAWNVLQSEQAKMEADRRANLAEIARRRQRAIEEEQEDIRRAREEEAIAAELGRQRRWAEEQKRVQEEQQRARLTQEAQERQAAAETLRQAEMAARAKAQAKYMPRGPRGSSMGFGHYHNWT